MFSPRSELFLLVIVPDINKALRTSFRESFSNKGRPSDGYIYRQIRLYSLQGNADAKGQ